MKKILPDDLIRTNGFEYLVMERQGNAVLVSFTKYRCKKLLLHSEVWLLKKHPRKVMPNGEIIEAREACPPNESWGSKGWTFFTHREGKKFFDILTGGLSEGKKLNVLIEEFRSAKTL